MPKKPKRKSTERIGRWRKIYARMWADNKFRALSSPPPCGQYLWIYLLAGPQTTPVPGLCVTGEAGLAESLGWALEPFRERFREIADLGMAKADWNARLIYLPNAIRFNEPENPNIVLGWRTHWDEMPDCQLKAEAFAALKAYFSSKNDESFQDAFQRAIRDPGFAERLPEGFGEPLVERLPKPGAGAGTGTGGIYSAEKPPTNGEVFSSSSNGHQARHPEQGEARKEKRVLHPPDDLFMAIAEVTGSDPDASASHIGSVRKSLLKAKPPYTADEVRRWAPLVTERWPDYPPTLGMLEKYIGMVRGKKVGPKPARVESETDYEARTERRNREQRETIEALRNKRIGGTTA